MKHWHLGITAAALLATASAACAHTIDATGAGFAAGALHPLSGFDHLLVMLAVGAWAGQMGGRALWRVPATFVLVMLIGGTLSLSDIPLAHIEAGIAASLEKLKSTPTNSRLSCSLNLVTRSSLVMPFGHCSAGALHHVGIALGYFARGWNARLMRVGGLAVLAAGTWLLGSI